MRGAALLLVACAAVPILGAVEGPLIEPPLVAPHPTRDPHPGDEVPAAPAKPVAVEFTWEDYRSLVVVGDGVGQIRPAWVVTYEKPLLPDAGGTILGPVFGLFGYHDEKPVEKLVVAYRAQAWLDAQGRMHIDAKSAVISGPQADDWSPDSFVFTFPDRVETVDDQDRSNRGTIDRLIDPVKDAAAYQLLMTKAQVSVGDGI